MTSDKPDTTILRFKVINIFTERQRCLTLMQIYQMLNKDTSFEIIGQIIESLILSGIVSQCGLTKCQWTSEIVETFHAKETE